MPKGRTSLQRMKVGAMVGMSLEPTKTLRICPATSLSSFTISRGGLRKKSPSGSAFGIKSRARTDLLANSCSSSSPRSCSSTYSSSHSCLPSLWNHSLRGHSAPSRASMWVRRTRGNCKCHSKIVENYIIGTSLMVLIFFWGTRTSRWRS